MGDERIERVKINGRWETYHFPVRPIPDGAKAGANPEWSPEPARQVALANRISAIGIGSPCEFYIEGPHRITGVLGGVNDSVAVVELSDGESDTIPLEKICAFGRRRGEADVSS